MVVAELSIIPLGTGTSASRYVRAALTALKKSGIKFENNAMGTVIEAKTLDEVFNAVKKAEKAVFDAGAERVVVDVRIDDRRDKEISIESKKKAVIVE